VQPDEVLAIVTDFKDAGRRVWIDGGWGIDTLLGEVTRHHEDVDLVVELGSLGAVLACLSNLGFVTTEDLSPVRVVLTSPDGRRVDLLPVTFDEDGTGWQIGASPDGSDCPYPAEGFTVGRIMDVVVPCLTAELQIEHHSGYTPRERDREDMTRLAVRFGLHVPQTFGTVLRRGERGTLATPEQPLDSHHRSGFMLDLVDDLTAIGEFSDRSGLSAKRPRSYAAEGLLAPAAVDPSSGYRYYSPGQLADAKVIDALRQAGVPLAEIRDFIRLPSEERLDAWAKKLDSDAKHRQRALSLARHLLTESEDPFITPATPDFKERLMATLRTAGRTDIGQVRENNEDVIVSSDRLALVADRMGGHPGGEIAASVAAGVIPAVFTGQSEDELEAAVRAANWAIRDRAVGQSGLEGMGTTICAAGLLTSGNLALVNVGDSRAYLWHEGALSRLTKDHSVTADLIERGELREEEAAQHPYYGVLTRALGVGPDVEIDRRTTAVEKGDRVLLCSDGLFNELSGDEIGSAVEGARDPAAIVDALIERVNARGGRDNISVVVAEVAA